VPRWMLGSEGRRDDGETSVDRFFMPMRMIGAILLGEQAKEPPAALAGAIAGGLAVHMLLSAIYGIARSSPRHEALRANRS
jgi:hypothetical protein